MIEQVVQSGLRGRGGAGYPTGSEVEHGGQGRQAGQKYVICNADEGDPGAFMDRACWKAIRTACWKAWPSRAYAVGASEGLHLRPRRIPAGREAPEDRHPAGRAARPAGQRSSAAPRFSFHVDIRLGAGAFVCGEETALIASIEGKRGTPRPRPPYPAAGRPVGPSHPHQQRRDLRQYRADYRNGGDWFARIGTEKSKGTKVFALAGRVANTGLIEVPMGITLREIIFDIGGGIPDGRQFKAVQTGGPSGGCIPEQYLDSPVDYESLARSRLHHGLRRHDRHGRDLLHGGRGQVLHGVLHERIVRQVRSLPGRAPRRCTICWRRSPPAKRTLADLALLEELCDLVKNTSLCGLGQSAPNPVLTTLRYFRDEYAGAYRAKSAVRPASVRRMPQEVAAMSKHRSRSRP